MRRSLFVALFAVALAAGLSVGSPQAQEAVTRVPYRGELFDDASRPISGVFPLTFSLLGPTGDPIWSERQFVAVFNGEYAVELGRNEGVPRAYAGSEQRLRVSLGDGVVAEHVFRLETWDADPEPPPPRITPVGPIDLAGRAARGDRAHLAHDCRTLRGRTAEELDHFVDLRNQLDEIRTRIHRPAGNRLGSETVTLERIGGESGLPYERACPPGFAITGARGGHGQLIDSFRPICTQLE